MFTGFDEILCPIHSNYFRSLVGRFNDVLLSLFKALISCYVKLGFLSFLRCNLSKKRSDSTNFFNWFLNCLLWGFPHRRVGEFLTFGVCYVIKVIQ